MMIATTTTRMIDGDRIDHTDETHAMRRRMRRNAEMRSSDANVKRNESANVMLDQNDTETKRTTSHAGSSFTPTKMIVVACRTGRIVTGSGSGNGRKYRLVWAGMSDLSASKFQPVFE